MHLILRGGNNMNLKDLRLKGFSLVEILIGLLVVSIIISSTMLVMSTRKKEDVNVDKNAQDCLLKEGGNLASVACNAAILGCRFNQEASCNALISYTKKTSADKMHLGLNALKESCKEGGNKACDYLIQNCIEDKEKCDAPFTNGDVRYFLTLLTSQKYKGREYIGKQVMSYYKNGTKNIVNEINMDCPTPCNDAGDNYYRTACDVLRKVKGKGFCADVNASNPNTPPMPIPPEAPTDAAIIINGKGN